MAFSSIGGIVLKAKIFVGGAPVVLILTIISIFINRPRFLSIFFAFFFFILLFFRGVFFFCFLGFCTTFSLARTRRLDERLFLLDLGDFDLFFGFFLRSFLIIVVIKSSFRHDIFILSCSDLFCGNR